MFTLKLKVNICNYGRVYINYSNLELIFATFFFFFFNLILLSHVHHKIIINFKRYCVQTNFFKIIIQFELLLRLRYLLRYTRSKAATFLIYEWKRRSNNNLMNCTFRKFDLRKDIWRGLLFHFSKLNWNFSVIFLGSLAKQVVVNRTCSSSYL